MEFLMFLFLVLFPDLNQSVEQTVVMDVVPITVSTVEIPGVTIVMSDDILFVNVDVPNDPIDDIELFDSSNVSVLRAENCNATEWSVDLSTLSSGDYSVEVFTTLANTFSATITIN
ncbi:MAG: hypothetical protein AAGG68_15960 [Bacteroidota bacterium]